jgi:hypothetical protein
MAMDFIANLLAPRGGKINMLGEQIQQEKLLLGDKAEERKHYSVNNSPTTLPKMPAYSSTSSG